MFGLRSSEFRPSPEPRGTKWLAQGLDSSHTFLFYFVLFWDLHHRPISRNAVTTEPTDTSSCLEWTPGGGWGRFLGKPAFSSRTEWNSKVILKEWPFVKEKGERILTEPLPRLPLNNSHNTKNSEKKKGGSLVVCEFVNKSVKANPQFIFNVKNRERPSKACLEVWIHFQ